jgi:hypothetical protein
MCCLNGNRSTAQFLGGYGWFAPPKVKILAHLRSRPGQMKHVTPEIWLILNHTIGV